MDIVDDVILDKVEDDDFVLPKKPLLKRVANRFRAKKRPQEPADLEFEVNSSLRISILKARIIFLLLCGSLKHLYTSEKQLANPKEFRKSCILLVVYTLYVLNSKYI